MSDFIKSSVVVGTRVPKTEGNRFGWVDGFKPDINKPCVIVLPGDGTDIPKHASGMLKPFEDLLKKRGCSEAIDCCSVYYRFNHFNSYVNTARHQLMNNAGRGINLGNNLLPAMQAEISNPQYIDELFDAFFKERIQTPTGKRLPVDEVVRMMRNVTFFGHCHGAYTYAKLEEKLVDSLKLLGYTPSEQALILKNVSGVMYAPYAPLGNSKTNVVSFANVQDRMVQHHNQFQRAVQALDKKGVFTFSYFPDTNGNVFLSPTNGLDPHNWNFYFQRDKINTLKLPDSHNPDIPDWIDLRDGGVGVKALEDMMGNAVVNNALRGLETGDVPSVQSLVGNYREISDGTIKINEEYSRIYQEVYHKSAKKGQEHLMDIRQNIKEYHQARKEQLEYLRKIEVNDYHKKQLEFDRALLAVQNKDGFAFLKKDSPALEFFKEVKVPFEFDEALNGYVLKGDGAKYLFSMKYYAQMRLDNDFAFIFERKTDGYSVSYVSPDGCYISPERAAKLIERYRDVNSYNPMSEIDLEYDATNSRLKIADHSVKIYENYLTGRRNVFDVFSSLELKDDRYVIRFGDTEGFDANELLKNYNKTFREFGVNTSIDGEYLVFDDINEIRRLNNFENIMRPYDGIEDFLPASIAHYFSNEDVDLNVKEIKNGIQKLVEIEKGLSPFIRYDYRGMWVKLDTQDGRDLLTQLNNRAKAYGLDNSYFSKDGELFFDDKIEARLFLDANINKNGTGLVPIDEANACMAELLRDFKREGIHVAQNMDTVSRIDTSDLLTDTPEGRVDMNRETSASPNASGADVNHIQVSSPNNRGAKLAALGTKAMTTLEVLGVMGDVAGAAIDPQGTAEFHDDLLHGRFEKILIDLEKGFNVIETQPFSETYNQFKKSLSDAIAENYEGAETMGDYASKTGENILGVVVATAGSILDAGTALVNKGYEFFDSDTRVVRHNVSVKDAKSDPVTYLKDRVQSETVNIKTGVRSDDTYFSIIKRNDARAMMNYINHLPGQWYGIQSRIDLEYVFNQEDGSKKHIKTTQTPVVYAAFNHRYDMVGLLTGDLRMHAYVYDTDKDTQQTPLMHLLDCMPSPYSYFSKDREKHKQPIALLLKHQACTIENLNKVDKWGNSAFLYASKCSDSAIIASLMKKGVNIAQKNNMGENALHLYQGSDYKIIATLVQAGVDMDAKDKNGMTPLMKQLSMYISNPTPEAKMRLNAFLICANEKQLNDLCLNQNMALQLGNVLSAQPEMMRVFKQYHPKVISTLHLDEMAVGDENQEVPLNAPDGVVVSLKEKEGTMQTQEQPHLDERLANNSSIVKEGPQNGIVEQQKTSERV